MATYAELLTIATTGETAGSQTRTLRVKYEA